MLVLSLTTSIRALKFSTGQVFIRLNCSSPDLQVPFLFVQRELSLGKSRWFNCFSVSCQERLSCQENMCVCGGRRKSGKRSWGESLGNEGLTVDVRGRCGFAGGAPADSEGNALSPQHIACSPLPYPSFLGQLPTCSEQNALSSSQGVMWFSEKSSSDENPNRLTRRGVYRKVGLWVG